MGPPGLRRTGRDPEGDAQQRPDHQRKHPCDRGEAGDRGEGGGVPGMVAGIIVAHAVFAMGVARTGWEPHYPLSIACASAA